MRFNWVAALVGWIFYRPTISGKDFQILWQNGLYCVMMQAIHKRREKIMQTTTEKLYHTVALYWSKGKDSKIIKRTVLDNALPMTHNECMVFISKFSHYPGRTFTVQEIS